MNEDFDVTRYSGLAYIFTLIGSMFALYGILSVFFNRGHHILGYILMLPGIVGAVYAAAYAKIGVENAAEKWQERNKETRGQSDQERLDGRED